MIRNMYSSLYGTNGSPPLRLTNASSGMSSSPHWPSMDCVQTRLSNLTAHNSTFSTNTHTTNLAPSITNPVARCATAAHKHSHCTVKLQEAETSQKSGLGSVQLRLVVKFSCSDVALFPRDCKRCIRGPWPSRAMVPSELRDVLLRLPPKLVRVHALPQHKSFEHSLTTACYTTICD